MKKHITRSTTTKKLFIATSIGLLVALGMALIGQPKYALLAGLDAAEVVYIIWVWIRVMPMNAQEAKTHAIREDPGRAASDIILIIASLASLVAVIFYLLQAGNATGFEKIFDIVLGLVSIVVSWFLVHTTFALKYARLFYGHPHGDIDFNEKDAPRYADFAYLAFTLGMTFQVSDTDIRTKEMRGTVLKHALLSYLFGTVIIATTINMLASLSS